MKKIVINADDLGYRENVNKGIIFAHKNGIVSSASLFVEKEGVGEAVQFAKENPALGLGPHIDLDKFFEIDHTHGTFTNYMNPSDDEVAGEAKRQIEKFFSFGLKADHLDSHHHTHLYPKVFPIICRVAKEFNIPIVRLFGKFYSNPADYEASKKIAGENNLKVLDHFIEGWYWGNVDEPFEIAELMTHPGYGELWREAELAHCCQRNLKDYFVAQQIEVLRFSDIVNNI
jgi:predicted glycoside hydrolase/deacetylase ChbG (UPF0249 family)